jgi:predicted secreted acid phosphatase
LIGRSLPDKTAIDSVNIINDKDLRRQQIKTGVADCYHDKADKQTSDVWASSKLIIMQVGDNIEDFSGVTQEDANITELLQQWPQKLILLPNPMYGSW